MSHRIALTGTVLTTLLIAVSYLAALVWPEPPAWAAWTLAWGTAGLLVSLMALGASRRGRGLGFLAGVFGIVFLILAGAFSLVLAWPGNELASGTLWLGLPPRAAIVIYGLGILPVVLLPLAYAMEGREGGEGT